MAVRHLGPGHRNAGRLRTAFRRLRALPWRQKLHRIIDISLISLASVSAAVFLLAFAVIRYFGPRHAFLLEVAALAGFALSALIWLIVAVATPAPMAVVDAAKLGARHVHDRLPAEIRERLPEELRMKITGS